MQQALRDRDWRPPGALSRAIDVVLALLLLVVTAPLLLAIALAIRCVDGAPMLFVQRRLGRGGAPFPLVKFRTLARDGRTIARDGGTVARDGGTVAPTGDPRASALGRFLRRTRLDELPQLALVLRGHLAFVGPRPEVPANLEHVPAAELADLQRVRPGLCGPTQLAFLAEDDVLATRRDPAGDYRRRIVPAKVRADLAWLRHRTLAGDLLVLLRTPFEVLSRRTRQRSRDRVQALLDESA